MILRRTWAMPSPNTFSIKPIHDLIMPLVNLGGVWVDPFCRDSVFKSACTYTNDMNSKFSATHCMDALDFLNGLPAESVDGILFDPPFSPRQVKEAYQGFGPADTTRAFYSQRKHAAARVLKLGGIAIVCAWNSLGLGKKNGMELLGALFVCHGNQNDTVVTVGQKIKVTPDASVLPPQ